MKFPLPRFIHASVKAKFLLFLLVIILTLATLLSLFFIQYQISNQKRIILNDAKAFSNLSVRPLGSAYNDYFDSGFIKFKEIADNILSLNENITKIQIVDVNGVVLYDSLDNRQTGAKLTQAERLEAVSTDKASSFENASGDVVEIVEPFFDDFGSHQISVRYFISYSTLLNSLFQSIPLAILIILFISVGSILLLLLIVNRTIIFPIETIAYGAGLVSKGQLDHRITLTTGDELEALSNEVNQMASSLQASIEALKDLDRLKDEFIIIASHNLRTPLTAIKGYLSIIGSEEEIKKHYSEMLAKISLSVAKLESIVEELINIVSLETRKTLGASNQINLNQLLQSLVENYSEKAAKKKVKLTISLPATQVLVLGDETKLKVALGNLIDNAIKFNKEGGQAEVEMVAASQEAVISIVDSGIGISEKEVPLVFEKFHRATDILRYNYEGLGLGLYLTKIIVEAHKGKVWFESKAEEGSRFFVSLPKFDTNLEKSSQ